MAFSIKTFNCPIKYIMTKKPNPQVALSTRLDRDVYDSMKELLDITGKSVAVFTEDAITQYISSVVNPKAEPIRALKIDQYAWSLKK